MIIPRPRHFVPAGRFSGRHFRGLAAYIRELRKERDAWLYQHALNKVRVITRSMKPDEKEAYLRSSAFGNTLAAIRRRDSVDQALSRGELPLSWQRAEFDRLAPLIRQELSRGNDIRLVTSAWASCAPYPRAACRRKRRTGPGTSS